MTVYVTLEGEYSERHIEAVFTDHMQAAVYCAIHEGAWIEEYEVDSVKLETSKEPKKIWKLPKHPFWEYVLEEGDYTFEDVQEFNDRYCAVSLPIDVKEEEAKKILRDKYAKWKAENSGV